MGQCFVMGAAFFRRQLPGALVQLRRHGRGDTQRFEQRILLGLFHKARDAAVLDEVAPVGDEVVLTKTSSSVFISTNLHYVLGNLGIKQLIIVGALTDQCVDSAVRDACDLGYLVTLPVDACATQSKVRHETSLANNAGYCRQMSTQALLMEFESLI